MQRVIAHFNPDTFKQLMEYIMAKHGRRRARSITIQQAVREFLEGKDEKLETT